MRSSNFGLTIPRFTILPALLLTGACVHAGPRQPPPSAPFPPGAPQVTPGTGEVAAPSAAAQPSPTPGAAGGAGALEPPDGKWLLDDLGRHYFLMEVPNVAGTYAWVGEDKKKVRIAYGLTFDVADFNDSVIHVKVYKTDEGPSKPARHVRPPEEIAAEYAPAAPTADQFVLRPFDEGLPTSGQWREGFAVKDIDGDGQLDIVSGPARKTGSRPAIFLGDGAGHWRSWSDATFPPIAFDYGDADVGDLNGDGKADLVLASHLRGITALLGDGSGHFRPWSSGIEFATRGDPTTGALPFSSRAIKVVDWNGDHRPDVVALSEGPSLLSGRNVKVAASPYGLVIYLNNGDGTWQKTNRAVGGSRFYGEDLKVADVDGDGRLDIVVGSQIQGFKSLLQRGLPDGAWESTAVEQVREKAIVGGVGVGDVDGDGRADLVIGYQSFEGQVWRTGVDVLFAQKQGGWRRRVLANEESMDGIYALALGDLDGDGTLDVVGLTGGGAGWIFLGDGKGDFVRELGGEISEPGCRGHHLELSDLDHDGKAEVIAEFAGEGQGLLQTETPCPSGGSIRAWKVLPR